MFSTSILIPIVSDEVFLTLKPRDASGYSMVENSKSWLSTKVLPSKSSTLNVNSGEIGSSGPDSSFEQEKTNKNKEKP